MSRPSFVSVILNTPPPRDPNDDDDDEDEEDEEEEDRDKNRRSFANQMIRSDGAATLRRSLETKMDEKFIIVWTIDGETTNIPHSTQDAALYQAEKLLRKHGCDLEIPYIWMMRYLRRLPFGSIESGCGDGVLPGSQPSKSKDGGAQQGQ